VYFDATGEGGGKAGGGGGCDVSAAFMHCLFALADPFTVAVFNQHVVSVEGSNTNPAQPASLYASHQTLQILAEM